MLFNSRIHLKILNKKNKKNTIFIYNSLTHVKEKFITQNSNNVKMYVCGPTVYGLSHLGHARSSITFDILNRYLKYCGYNVKFIRNYTDVGHLEYDSDDGDDKIQKQAQKENIEPMEIVQKYINKYRRDMDLLNILQPSIEPQASGYIQEQINIISNILSKGFAYVVNGSVYFDIKKYKDKYKTYGILSGKNIDELFQETRVLNNQNDKKNNCDFALWKKADQKHIMRWESPWSEGYPGWHTECIALCHKFLGDTIDIHGGGLDLQFPHHEAEIAQAQVAFEKPLAHFWVHNNLVNINNQKMSKSLNNFITLEDLFFNKNNIFGETFDPMILRFLFLQTHYRSPLSVSKNALESAKKGYCKLLNAIVSLKNLQQNYFMNIANDKSLENRINTLIEEIFDFMNDDLNTPNVLSNLFELTSIINDFEYKKYDVNAISKSCFDDFKNKFIVIFEKILGFKEVKKNNFLNLIINLYNGAKKRKDYEEIDFIRHELEKENIKITDFNDFSTIKYN